MDNLGAGIGRAADELDMITISTSILFIIISLILFSLSRKRKSPGFKILYGIVCGITSLIAILCFQHEVGLYKTACVLTIVSLLGFIKIFRKSK